MLSACLSCNFSLPKTFNSYISLQNTDTHAIDSALDKKRLGKYIDIDKLNKS